VGTTARRAAVPATPGEVVAANAGFEFRAARFIAEADDRVVVEIHAGTDEDDGFVVVDAGRRELACHFAVLRHHHQRIQIHAGRFAVAQAVLPLTEEGAGHPAFAVAVLHEIEATDESVVGVVTVAVRSTGEDTADPTGDRGGFTVFAAEHGAGDAAAVQVAVLHRTVEVRRPDVAASAVRAACAQCDQAVTDDAAGEVHFEEGREEGDAVTVVIVALRVDHLAVVDEFGAVVRQFRYLHGSP